MMSYSNATIFDFSPRRYQWDDATRFYMAYPEEIPDELLPQYGFILLKRKALHVELSMNNRAQKKRKLELAPPTRGYRYLDYDRGLKQEARRRRRAMRRLAAGTRYVPEPMDIDGPDVSCLMVAEVPVVFGGVRAAEEAEEEEQLGGDVDEEDLQAIMNSSLFYEESSDDDFLADLSLPGSDA